MACFLAGSFMEEPAGVLLPGFAAMGAVSVVGLARYLRPGWRPARTQPFSTHLLLITLAVAPALLTSRKAGLSLLLAGGIYAAYFTYFALKEAFTVAERGLLSPRAFAWVLVVSGPVTVVLRLVGRAFGRAGSDGLPWYFLAVHPLEQTPGGYGHLYDFFLMLIFPLLAAFWALNLSRAAKWIIGASAAVTAFGMALSFSRAVWLAATVESVLIAIFHPRLRWIMVGGCLFLAGAALCIPGIPARLATLLAPEVQTNSQRLDLWAASLQLIGQSPFAGHGLGSFGELYRQLKGGAAAVRLYPCPHNLYLHIAVECGVPALGIFLAWVLAPFRRLPGLAPAGANGAPDYQGAIRFGGLVAVAGVLCFGLFDM
jgi:hypothetical protein